MPSIYSWYVGVQRELPARFSLDVSYSGNHAIHLMDQRKVNAVPANTFVVNPNLRQSVNFKNDALRPYYGWGSLTRRRDPGVLALRRDDGPPRAGASRTTLRSTSTTPGRSAMDLLDNDSDNIINPFNIAPELGPGRLRPDRTSSPPTSSTTFPKVTGRAE